jgi:transposase-like protein
MAVDRLNQCENIVALAKELGISRRLLYTWREQLEPLSSGEGPPGTSREATLRKEVSCLKRALAEKTLEVDFFKGALREVQARRRRRGDSGETASTLTSGM